MKGCTGFSFRGVHTTDLGVLVKTLSRALLPQMKHFEVSPPGLDGSFDFSEANEYGRSMYEDRIFEAELFYTALDVRALQKVNAKVAGWLCGGRDRLVFDDMPEVYWMAKVVSQVEYTPAYKGTGTALKVVFRAEPFAYGEIVYPFADGIAVTNGRKDLTFNVLGTAPAKPFIKLDAPCRFFSYRSEVSGIFDIHDAPNGFYADAEKQVVLPASGNGKLIRTAGEFPELKPGALAEIEMLFEMSVSERVNLELGYRPRYIYGVME